jgi:heme-degrading monooxygenase HmoA
MYTLIRSYELAPEMREDFMQRMRERLLPSLSQVEGFIAFMLLQTGENEVLSLTTFQTFSAARASSPLTKKWHREQANLPLIQSHKLVVGQVQVRYPREEN